MFKTCLALPTFGLTSNAGAGHTAAAPSITPYMPILDRQSERDGQGSYRVILENVGFEHVSCRVSIERLATTTSGKKQPGQPPRLVARASYNEISSGFWSCNPKTVGLAGATLTIHGKHTYSGENHKFCAVLGAPGEYRDQGLC